MSYRSSIKHVGLPWLFDQAGWSLIRQVGLLSGILVSYQTCWSPIRHVGLRSIISVSNGSPTRYFGIQTGNLVSYQAGWSLIRQVGLLSGLLVSYQTCWSPIRHVSLQSGMPVSDVWFRELKYLKNYFKIWKFFFFNMFSYILGCKLIKNPL